MDEGQSSRIPTGAWVVVTVMIWPVWHWAATSLATYPLSWLASLSTSIDSDSAPGGIFDGTPQVFALGLAGLAFGFLGIYVLRMLGAPRIVWVPAAVVSMAIYLATALFWAGFSGTGTGFAHIAGQFVIATAVGATVGLGAWLGSRARVSVQQGHRADGEK